MTDSITPSLPSSTPVSVESIAGGALRRGADPALDAWLIFFLHVNSLDYALAPELNASPEQLRFMVRLEDDGFYAPCSDEMLALLLYPCEHVSELPALDAAYRAKWEAFEGLLESVVPAAHNGGGAMRIRVRELARYLYEQARSTPVLLPSRLIKRLLSMLLTLTGQDDPCRERKREANRHAAATLGSPGIARLLSACSPTAFDAGACATIDEYRRRLDMLELSRLLYLSTRSELWQPPPAGQTVDLDPATKEMERELGSEVWHTTAVSRTLDNALGAPARAGGPRTILFMADTAGGLLFDIRICRMLLERGHKVVLALKSGSYFEAPAFWDWEGDTVLAEALQGAHLLADDRVSKNELVRLIREHDFLVIADGTREELNFYRASVTFARAFKEAHLIIAKGLPAHRRLIATATQFTRDVLCFHRDEAGTLQVTFKPRHPDAAIFSEQALHARADAIIAGMRAARVEGRSVLFYSGIIGSIPGQTQTAIRVLDALVADLRERQPALYVVNPTEYFEEGMDADDLMYMWERVQRSGLIDIWRFQTVADIERAFTLLGDPVPPFWAGKDATYSTGCTKEMRIALSVQEQHPEMQIIGPSPERFFRRREYGVGKFCDSAIDCT